MKLSDPRRASLLLRALNRVTYLSAGLQRDGRYLELNATDSGGDDDGSIFGSIRVDRETGAEIVTAVKAIIHARLETLGITIEPEASPKGE